MLPKRAVVSTDPFRSLAGARLFSVAALVSFSAACSPYPDDGEFLAGVVYAQNFITGVKTIDRLRASAIATTPFWTDSTGKRSPLDVVNAGQVYFFNGSCAPTSSEPFDERLDLIHNDRQYPVFADLPEVLSTSGGRPGRKTNYSAVVEVIHLSGPGTLPCQSLKRFDTVTGRLDRDLKVVSREYRLYQIIDPALTPNVAPPAPLPVQLGFFNQLGGMDYSPICEERQLTGQAMAPPPDASSPAYLAAKKTGALASCLPCQTVTVDASGVPTSLRCPFASSQVTGN